MEGTPEMQHDLPTAADAARRLSLKNVTVSEAREKVIQFLTEHWKQSLIALAQKLIQQQGFSDEEATELCLSFRPMFEQNLTQALAQFDRDADSFIAGCSANG